MQERLGDEFAANGSKNGIRLFRRSCAADLIATPLGNITWKKKKRQQTDEQKNNG
jgi:hypothetical protein